MTDAAAVVAANERFYSAFEARDIDAMQDAWEHTDRAACTHPGWVTRHGWAAVRDSWVALFANNQRLQFIITNQHVHVAGDVAWVCCDENLIDGATAGTVASLNVFVRDANAAWKLVAHHASPVVERN